MAVEQLARWQQEDVPPIPESINFSALQISDEGFHDYLVDLLRLHHIDPEWIHIEITEHIFVENKTAAIGFLQKMRGSGFRIAVDDFGSEYSSLNYLSTLPIDIIKFDRELNLRLLSMYEPEVMGNLIAFVHSLNLTVVAEGIEEEAHVRQLKACGCDAIQGYWFSPPVPPGDISEHPGRTYALPAAPTGSDPT
jgi:EAL domain-containing protein (putative c-di-GMP-specific phosphodiesterase class I)